MTLYVYFVKKFSLESNDTFTFLFTITVLWVRYYHSNSSSQEVNQTLPFPPYIWSSFTRIKIDCCLLTTIQSHNVTDVDGNETKFELLVEKHSWLYRAMWSEPCFMCKWQNGWQVSQWHSKPRSSLPVNDLSLFYSDIPVLCGGLLIIHLLLIQTKPGWHNRQRCSHDLHVLASFPPAIQPMQLKANCCL